MRFLVFISFFFFITSCNFERSLEDDVRLSIKNTMNSEFPDFEIESFKLRHISDNYYEGILRTNEYDEVYTYYVDVVLYENDYFEWEIRETETYNSNFTDEDIPNEHEVDQYTPLSLKEYLTQNSFYLNGNGSVTFTFNSYSDQGTIRISGGRANLLGQCEIINDVIYIENLTAISGHL